MSEEIYLDVCLERMLKKLTKKKKWYVSKAGNHYATLVVKPLPEATGRGRNLEAVWMDDEGGAFTLGQTKAIREEFFRQYKEFKKDGHERHDEN